MPSVKILIIDDDEASQSALRHVLDAEGWQVSVVPLAREGMARLARGPWTLVIVNVALVDVEGPIFDMLKELALAQPAPDQPRVSVLFVVPQLLAPVAKPVLEAQRLPYALKPIHLHDFLERVSDLLLESKSIPDPIRQVNPSRPGAEKRRTKERRGDFERRTSSMFASRKEYFMSEEEMAEYEKQEAEDRKGRGAEEDVKNLGSGKR
ncbi:MAG TPA: response regulator [Candidatus Acidoferrales bacterium]|nr:response regulator [Candidatus Acidoferrales bacterium]